ncbi:MAG TPA: 23S rRNA pseudouridine(1911/1915/1917) synthase RluD [Steroidobacteraceae bacterium]|jgi:23S rRNA pseudouridine1911/1915/1917 synthase
MAEEFQLHVVELPVNAAGQRLDQALAAALPQYSRARLQRWIREGAVKLAGATGAAFPRDRVRGGERIEVRAEFPQGDSVEAESLPLRILFEDEALLVLDKPAGLVVHPGAGNRSHTLQNALLGYDDRLARVPRAGLVHRLDKDTSGLLIVARTPEVHTRLVAALAARQIRREYLALVWGRPVAGGRIEQPIGRDRAARTRMAVSRAGRAAVTHFRIQERFAAHTLLRVQLETGRTHQIRVHLAHIGLPIVGDPVYGGRRRQLPAGALNDTLQAFPRQALHAERLSLAHPMSGREQSFEAPAPADLLALLAALRAAERGAVPAHEAVRPRAPRS